MGGNASCSACGCNDKQEERPKNVRQHPHHEGGGPYSAASAPPLQGVRSDDDDGINFGVPAHAAPHAAERHQVDSGGGGGQNLPWGLDRKDSPGLSDSGGADYRKEGGGGGHTHDSSLEQDRNTSAGTDRTHDGRGYQGSWGQATGAGTTSDGAHEETTHRHEELQDGSVFEGQFRGRDRHGRGRFTWSGGGSYDGQFDSNDMHGEGEYRWPDGSTYHGQWTRNNMGPRGVMQWTDGRKYEGEFMDGKKHGEGCLTWPDGRSYVGQWEAGKQHGIGTTVTGRGLRRQSQWEHGKLVRWLECQPDNGGAPDVGGTPPYGAGGPPQRPDHGAYSAGRQMYDG